MPRFLYIPKINQKTFLHFSYKRSSWKLRDYSEGLENLVLHSSNSEYSVNDICSMAVHDLRVPEHRKVTEVIFWRDETKKINAKYTIGTSKLGNLMKAEM